ncbi:MAG: ribosomal subunit interface protein [Betaproteobacteria bacterium TMED156]|nr:MAG: ribosomal subunit interface protein [Betaproteobacteria bacterium TMED156]|tara:strand:- start:363 stop:674 length:312 start_codon:yes stop_codon:yes gene_type:complete
MNLKISGHQISVTPAIRDYIIQKFAKIQRHYSHDIDAYVVIEVNKLISKIELTTHLPKKDLHLEVEHSDMYAAIDLIADKLDRQVIRYKEIHNESVHSGKSLV